MIEALKHRGPDSNGKYISKECLVGHLRLSIIDTAKGRQPIYNEDKTKAIVANGEIYNYKKIKKSLIKNHLFRTGSDVEAILHLYEDVGTNVVRYLDGMYAFCIIDGNDLFIARDGVGIKPLYYLIEQNKKKFCFSSELKNMNLLEGNVKEFPPGTWYHTRYGFRRFYQTPQYQPKQGSVLEYIRILRKTLHESVKKRLMSEVPVGAFLSGGLDSSIIAALASKEKHNLNTFSVGFKESPDLQKAREVAQHIGSKHHEYILNHKEVREELPNIIYYLESYDQDLVRSAIPCYFVSKLASKYVKVILTGEGADELFAGYDYFKSIQDKEKLAREMTRTINTLHNINLQRVDRMTMAHSIEGRVPFLDREMIRIAQTIPISLKSRGNPSIEKWILRKAFEDILPKNIVWRKKEQFDKGSGSTDTLSDIISPECDFDVDKYKKEHQAASLQTKEECYYHQLFLKKFPIPQQIYQNIGRWSIRPEIFG